MQRKSKIPEEFYIQAIRLMDEILKDREARYASGKNPAR